MCEAGGPDRGGGRRGRSDVGGMEECGGGREEFAGGVSEAVGGEGASLVLAFSWMGEAEWRVS